MEYRFLGDSGLRVSTLSFGAMTFGGSGRFESVGTTQLEEATRLVDLCLEAGVNLFDTADVYSNGMSEEILGQALGERRDDVLLATKLHGPIGDGPNDRGQSRHHIVRACEASLRRLGTEHLDLYQIHGFDALTPLEESLSALDDLVRAGKVRYLGCSNLSGWHLLKSLGVADAHGWERFASLQAYYSLVARELEHELIPACLDQGVGILVWSPLSGGFLTGKYRRGQDGPEGTRRSRRGDVGTLDEEQGYDVIDVLDEVARARGITIPQAALAYLLRKPGVTSLVVGARNPDQLGDNLRAAEWEMTDEEVARLDAVSDRPLPYPYWHQRQYNADRIPALPSTV